MTHILPLNEIEAENLRTLFHQIRESERLLNEFAPNLEAIRRICHRLEAIQICALLLKDLEGRLNDENRTEDHGKD